MELATLSFELDKKSKEVAALVGAGETRKNRNSQVDLESREQAALSHGFNTEGRKRLDPASSG